MLRHIKSHLFSKAVSFNQIKKPIKFICDMPDSPFSAPHILGVIRRLGHKVQAGVYILRYGHRVGNNNLIVMSPCQLSTFQTTATQLRKDEMMVRNDVVVVVVVTVRGVFRLTFSGRQIGRGAYYGNRIKGTVTYVYIGALSRFSVSWEPPFYSTVPASVFRGKNHKRCYLCRGSSSRQAVSALALFDWRTSNTAREAGCLNRGPNWWETSSF